MQRSRKLCSASPFSQGDKDFQLELGAAVHTVVAYLLLSPELVTALPPAPTTPGSCSCLDSSVSYGCSVFLWEPQVRG